MFTSFSLGSSTGLRHRRSTAVIGAVIGLLAASASVAAPNPAALPGAAGQPFKAYGVPAGASNSVSNFIVEMAGDPVSRASSKAAAPFSLSQERQTADALKSRQMGLEQQIQSAGGKLMATYQYAYNGMRVRIADKDAAKLATLPGVVAVRRAGIFKRDNVHGVPLIGGPAVWGGVPGFRGEGVKIAVIDSGIDYTHADFGGPGTIAAYQAALATDTAPADPALFGPTAPKVKGGTDLVGDDYDANPGAPTYQPVPHPDPNPLDCNDHGTHVSGTATGLGVLANGSTFHGPYDATTISSNSFIVGPGVAPLAKLYSIRVFGCTGSTDVVVDALEWAVANKMDVVNMSLGSSFGGEDTPDAVASSNAIAAGVVVVASAGNAGAIPYIVGSPSTGKGVLSVTASDPTASFPGGIITLGSGPQTTINANGASFSDGLSGEVKVARSGSTVLLGCAAADYAGTAGKIAVVRRGTCSRVARAIYGQQAGAIAVVMINSLPGFPPFEGPITGSVETGDFNVTIPFFGALPTTTATWLAADGTTATITNSTVANPGFLVPASFTSQGPGLGTNALKPNVTAPGVSIVSAGSGTGNGSLTLSGTSMAAPHTAGAMALVKQSHPTWKNPAQLEAALANTAAPSQVLPYAAHTAGGGLIQVLPATQTDVVAVDRNGLPSVSFGLAELGGDFSGIREISLINNGSSPAKFRVTSELPAGSPHSVLLSTRPVSVPAGGTVQVPFQLAVPAATAGTSATLNEVAGSIVFTPLSGQNNGVTLRVPYYLVPQATSTIRTKLTASKLVQTGSAQAKTTNGNKAPATGAADWYAWGLSKPVSSGLGASDLRAVGVQSDGASYVAFAVLSHGGWSTPFEAEFDIYVDVDGNGIDDYVVFNADNGLLTTGARNGQSVSAVFDLRTGLTSVQFLTDAPFNSTALVLPVTLSQLCAAGSPCLSAGNPRITYSAIAFDNLVGGSNVIPGTAKFNAFAPTVTNGIFEVVAPGASVVDTVSYDAAEAILTPALGFMIVSHDNPTGGEAQLIPLN